MTKFGRILRLTSKLHQKCSPLQVKALLPRKPGDKVELFWLWKQKWQSTLHSFQEWELQLERGEIIAKNNSEGDICYLWSWTNLNVHCTIEDELNIDAGKHVLAMYFN